MTDWTGATHSEPTLFIFAGLPGVGKTSLSQQLARTLKAAYLRIDSIEQALRDFCGMEVEGEGYALAYRLALDSLRLGANVVADSCNPIALTRRNWDGVARESGATGVNIEVICSDPIEHRRRVESRVSSVSGLVLPTWEEVERREYEAWTTGRMVIDTSGKSAAECFEELLSQLAARRN